VFALPAIIALWFRQKRVRFAAGLGAIVLVAAFYPQWNQSVIARARSFYGVYFIADRGEYRVLIHGTTIHGAQSLRPQTKCIPLTYYFPSGPLGQLFMSFQGEQAKSDIAVVGLGAGTIAGYAQPGQRWTFYEIDPTVERIARDPRTLPCCATAPQRAWSLATRAFHSQESLTAPMILSFSTRSALTQSRFTCLLAKPSSYISESCRRMACWRFTFRIGISICARFFRAWRGMRRWWLTFDQIPT
jgi:hypothetical protein